MSKIVFDFHGTPKEGYSCLPHGYGYRAYVCTDDSFICQLFNECCMWGAATDVRRTHNGDIFSQYEIDCRDKSIFLSPAFKRICEKHKVDLVISDDNEETNIM